MGFFSRQGWGRALFLASVMVAVLVGTAAAQQKGTFIDNRDGKTYKTVVIGGKKWMAENLNYQPPVGNSWCYGNDNSNCNKYGRLYDWNTAKTACPGGWHLPSREEWGQLAKAAGGTGDYGDDGTAGKKLKSTYGWAESGNGTDEFGVSALPGGNRNSDGSFDDAGKDGYWWTATEYGGGLAYLRFIFYENDYVYEYNIDESIGFSLRCRED